MSRKTEHYTPRQKDALYCESVCKRKSRQAERHWKEAAPYFAKMLNQKLYEELDHENFSEWAESLGISGSHAYSLAQLNGLPESVQDTLEKNNVSLGNIKLILPKLEEAIEQNDKEEVDELVDEASTMKWRDLQQRVHGDSPAPLPVINTIDCPICDSSIELSLSRAANIIVTKGTRKRGNK